MAYINTETMQYPVSEGEIRAEYPNTSFANPFIAPEPYAWVFPAPQPTYDAIYQGVREVAPVQANGSWQQAWEVFDLDQNQVAANIAAKDAALLAECVSNTQKRLDDFAKTRNYDGILSLCTYATSLNAKFKAEGQYGVEARDATWAKLYDMLAEVEAGTRSKPNGYADIESELPVLVWPQ